VSFSLKAILSETEKKTKKEEAIQDYFRRIEGEGKPD